MVRDRVRARARVRVRVRVRARVRVRVRVSLQPLAQLLAREPPLTPLVQLLEERAYLVRCRGAGAGAGTGAGAGAVEGRACLAPCRP